MDLSPGTAGDLLRKTDQTANKSQQRAKENQDANRGTGRRATRPAGMLNKTKGKDTTHRASPHFDRPRAC